MSSAYVKETRWTPGPWQVTDGGSAGNIIRTVDAPQKPIASLWINGDDIDANARLIAAAPDMYEALKAAADVLRMLTEPSDDDLKMSNQQAWMHSVEVSRKCTKAIAKAEQS